MVDLDPWLADFAAEALYDRSAWFVDRVIEVDPAALRVVAEMDTTALPLVDAQIVVPGHPRHVPAAVAVQATGTLGQLLATQVLGYRRTLGWVGFGTRIEDARWGRIATIGPPLTMTAQCTRQRTMMGTRFCWFAFTFTQEGERVYASRQIAAWRRDAPAT